MAKVVINYRRDIPPEFVERKVPFAFVYQFEIEPSRGSGRDVNVEIQFERKPGIGFCLSLQEALALSRALLEAVENVENRLSPEED